MSPVVLHRVLAGFSSRCNSINNLQFLDLKFKYVIYIYIYIYIYMIRKGCLVGFYGISTLVIHLILNNVYTYILDIYDL